MLAGNVLPGVYRPLFAGRFFQKTADADRYQRHRHGEQENKPFDRNGIPVRGNIGDRQYEYPPEKPYENGMDRHDVKRFFSDMNECLFDRTDHCRVP